jgi:hypothetical protein
MPLMRGPTLAFLLLSAGCPYSPSLGTTPFLCGSDNPVCPRGYNCQPDEAGMMVCVEDGKSAIPDAPPVNCHNDMAMEPNDTWQTAYATPLEGSLKHIDYAGLSICPGTDVDTYKVDILTSGTAIDVVMIYEPGEPLIVTLLDVTGTKVADGGLISGTMLVLHYVNTVAGAYYVQVSSPSGNENNYTLSITTSP